MSRLPGNATRPQLNVTDTEYRYSTVAGDYVFPKVSPFLLEYRTRQGEVLVNASSFVVLAPGISLFQSPEVLNATDYNFTARYGFSAAGALSGNVTITYAFRDDGPPKISARLRQSRAAPASPIVWFAFTLDKVVMNAPTVIDFGALPQPVSVSGPKPQLWVGPDRDTANWTRRVLMDWSDAQEGQAFAGAFSAGNLSASAVFVVFPAGVTYVDPTLVGTSTSSQATDYPIQRKTFEHGGRFWAFWYDGGSIAYASSQFSYANGQNTITWTAKMSTGSGTIANGFDVDQRDGTVLVGYVPSDLLSLKVLKGTITGSFITWSGPYVVNSWSINEAGPPSVAIGTDGYFWASSIRRGPGPGNPNTAWIYKSDGVGSTAFTLSASVVLSGAPSDSAVRLVTQASGGLVILTSTKGSTTAVTRRYWQGGWSSSISWDIKLPTADTRAEILTAIPNLKDEIYIVFKGDSSSAPGLRYVILKPDDTLSPPQPNTPYQIAGGTPTQPTTLRDLNGDIHVFWLEVRTSPLAYAIKYARQTPWGGSWTSSTEPFGAPATSRRGLTAGLIGLSQAFLAWTDVDVSPYSIQFGSVPTPMDLGSQTGDPWNRQGISPYQSYFRQLSEFVSPGSGLLTLMQTDLVLPGRQLNLDISRVFVTPRAFTGGTQPSAYLYEEYPNANLGKGWRLNFPWLSDQYLHLWNGQMYVIKWDGDKFENHDGEHFDLRRACVRACQYFLFMKSGIGFKFDQFRTLTHITDSTNNNFIEFSYGAYGISEITDTIGRKVVFAYNADGTLRSITSGAQVVTYSYQTVGGVTLLASVRDTSGRETRFWHNDTRNPYLLTTIRYPTGAKTVFTWSNPSVQVGSDLWAYFVTNQDTQNSAAQSVRANAFSYTVVNGRVGYVKVTTYDAGVAKGDTIQHLDSVAHRSTTIRRNAAGVHLNKAVSWFDRAGGVGQVDVYPGSSSTPSHSVYAAYDEWGNVIYSRDAIGHERFGSYVNTKFQGGFYAPGRLTRTVGTSSGLLLFDDFEDRDLSDWTLDPTAGSVGLDYTAFETLPPVVKVAHNGAASGVAAATHTFTAQPAYLVAEASVRAEETGRQHYVLLKSSTGSVRVYVSLTDQGYIAWWSGSAWNNLVPYQAKQWYRLAFEASVSANTYDIWVNNVEVKTGATMTGTGSIDRLTLQASCSGCGSATMYADTVKAYTSGQLSINALQAGQIVSFEDPQGGVVTSARVSSGQTSTTLWFNPGVLPYGTVKIYDTEGFLIHSSPTHEWWGADWFTFTQPWKAFPGRTRSGFLRSLSVYLDDFANRPSPTCANCYVGAEDGWDWGGYDFPVYGSQSHRSKYLTQSHQHYFQDVSTLLPMSSGQYHIQYLFIPDHQYPSEIMVQFRDTGNSWEHRAYWGADLIPWGDPVNNPNSRRSMGALPGPPGRWLMLIAKSDDVGTNGLNIEGLAYTLYGGRATWDFSAKGDAETGQIRVRDVQNLLPANWKAELYDGVGSLVASSLATPTGGTAAIDVYGSSRRVSAFPFEGYFVVKDAAGNPVYRSPVMAFWGGDIYDYGGTDFYPNTAVDSSIHDRVAGTLEYQTGRAAATPLPQMSFVRYTSQGLPDRSKVNDGSVWRETSYGYDGFYGLLTSVTDPKSNTVSYTYSPTYGRAYVTKVSDGVGTLRRNTYDPTTGWPLADIDGRGYLTRYAYDPLGRPTAGSRFDLPASSEVLYLDMEWTTEEATPRLEDLSGKTNHGTVSGATDAPGRVGRARSFDGNDYIRVGTSATLDLGTTLTFSAYVKVDNFATSHEILRKISFAPTKGYLFRTLTNGALSAQIWNNGNVDDFYTNANVLSAGGYYYVAFTFTGGVGQFYVNGRAVATGGSGGTQVQPQNTGTDLFIGINEDLSSDPMVGSIDELRIFNRALDAAEVGQLADASYGLLSSAQQAFDDISNVLTIYEPMTRPRILHYDMETLLNAKMEDLAGRGFHGGLTGTTATASGKVGGARDFDGLDDMVTATASPGLAASSAFTAASWINPDTLPTSAGDGIVGKLDFANAWRIWIRTDGRIEFDAKSDTVGNLVSTTALTTGGGWYHVAGTFDGLTAKLYLNGVAQASASTSDWGNTANVNVGVGDTDSTFPFDGQIDEVHLFSRALSDAEVTELYQGTEKGFYQKQYFDSLGRATRSLRRDMFGAFVSSETYVHNFQDRIVSDTIARSSTTSFTTTYAYDFLGRPTTVTYPDFPSNPLTVSYDDVNRIRTVVAENGRKIQSLYDLGGLTTAVREYHDATSYYTTSYAYNDVGNLLSVTNAFSQVTSHQYGNLNRLTKTTYPDTTKYEEYTYDEVGNLKTRRDRAGQVTTYNYDTRYRLAGIDYPGTTLDVSYAYDLSDNPTSVVTNPASPATTVAFTYDGLDRVLTENTTVGGVTYPVDYAYDAAGRLTRLTYPRNADSTRSWVDYTYDAVGRTSFVKNGATTFATFTYHADDLIKDVTLGNGIVQAYSYNGRAWPTRIQATYGATSYLDVSYAYDPSGNVLTMGPTSFTYDRLDRLKTAIGGFGSHFYDYDAVGNRKRLDTVFLRPNGAGSSTQWTRSGSGGSNWDRVDEPTQDGDTTYVYESTVADRDLYALQDNTATGTISAVTVTAVARAVWASSCDPNCYGAIKLRIGGSATDVSPTKTVGTSYEIVSHTWATKPGGGAWTDADLDSLQAGIELASGGTASAVRATQVFVTVNVGASVAYTYADGTTGMNTLSSFTKSGATTSFTYDANGNLDTKTGLWDYDWNPENLMTVAKLNSAQQQAYVYDGLGRRVKVDGTSSTTWTVSIFSGMDVIHEKFHVDGQSDQITKYIYANGMRIAKITPTGADHYYLGDHLGSTRQVRDLARNLVFSAEYEPFGKPYSVSGSEAYKFAAERHDDPTGLVYWGSRYYESETGRFVQADRSLGLRTDPQTLNRYSYTLNNPLRYKPSGGSSSAGARSISDLRSASAAGGAGVGIPLYLLGAAASPIRGLTGRFELYGYGFEGFKQKPHVKFAFYERAEKRFYWKIDYGGHREGEIPRWHRSGTFYGGEEPFSPRQGRLLEGVLKWGGRIAKGLILIAIFVDAFTLGEAVRYAEQTGDWQWVEIVAARIVASWTGAVIGSSVGVMYGARLGPWGAVGGALVGGIVGAILGEEAVKGLLDPEVPSCYEDYPPWSEPGICAG